MVFELNTQQQETQAAFKAFVDREIVPVADEFDRQEHLPASLISKLAQAGYLGAILPEAYQGQALDMITYGLLNEELGRGCSSVRSLITVQNMVAETILKWGREDQKERWLNKLATGELLAAFALSEPNVGSDAKGVETTITPDGDEYILNGRKHYVTFGQLADLLLIFGQHEGQACALLVERETPGLSLEPISGLLGVKASMTAEIKLSNCRVPAENMIGGIGFGFFPVALSALDHGRYTIAWGCVGIARACLEACLSHTSTRKQFGVYLKEHQLVQQMIANMAVNLKAARLLCLKAGSLRQRNHPNAITETMVAKYFASTTANRAASDAVQLHGAIGYSPFSPVQRYMRDAKLMEIIEGTSQIHQIKIAEFAYQSPI